MVEWDRAPKDLDLTRPADFSHQFPEPNPEPAYQDALAVRRGPDEVVLQVEPAVRPRALMLHTRQHGRAPQNLKESSEGEGLLPIARTIKTRVMPLPLIIHKSFFRSKDPPPVRNPGSN